MLGGERVRHAVAPVATVALVVAAGYDIPRFVPDSEQYAALARGHADQVASPFSQRVLHPALLRVLGSTGLGLRSAVVVVALVALVGFVVAMARLLRDLPRWAPFLLLAVPFTVYAYREAYLPDLAFAALLAGLLLVLRRSPRPWTALLLVPMFATRESTLLVAAVLAVVAWRRRLRALTAATVAAVVVGQVIEKLATAAGQQSLHQIGGLTYLVAKLPYNFMRNIVGVQVWTNDIVGTPSACTPHVTWRCRLRCSRAASTRSGSAASSRSTR